MIFPAYLPDINIFSRAVLQLCSLNVFFLGWSLAISRKIWETLENGAFWLAERQGHMTNCEISLLIVHSFEEFHHSQTALHKANWLPCCSIAVTCPPYPLANTELNYILPAVNNRYLEGTTITTVCLPGYKLTSYFQPGSCQNYNWDNLEDNTEVTCEGTKRQGVTIPPAKLRGFPIAPSFLCLLQFDQGWRENYLTQVPMTHWSEMFYSLLHSLELCELFFTLNLMSTLEWKIKNNYKSHGVNPLLSSGWKRLGRKSRAAMISSEMFFYQVLSKCHYPLKLCVFSR